MVYPERVRRREKNGKRRKKKEGEREKEKREEMYVVTEECMS